MKRTPDAPATPPIPPELAGEIDAAKTLITYLLMQRTAASPHKVRAFAAWEIKIRASLDEAETAARHTIGRDKPEAAALAAEAA